MKTVESPELSPLFSKSCFHHPTYTARILVIVAGTEHVLGDASRRGAAVAPPAPFVAPHFHIHPHQVGWLGAALSEGSPPGHSHVLVLEVLPVITCQADTLDVRVASEIHIRLESEDGNIVPLEEQIKNEWHIKQLTRVVEEKPLCLMTLFTLFSSCSPSLVDLMLWSPRRTRRFWTSNLLMLKWLWVNSKSKILIFYHLLGYTMGSSQDMFLIDEWASAKLAIAVHQGCL